MEGCIDESKLGNIGVPLVWRHTAIEVEGKVECVLSQYKLDLQSIGTFEKDEWGPWMDKHVEVFNHATNCMEVQKVHS